MKFWDIRGPRRFLEAISDAVLDGRVVFVHVPRNAPADLQVALREHLGYYNEIVEPTGALSHYLEAFVSDEEKARTNRIDPEFLTSKLAGHCFWIESSQVGSAVRLEDELRAFGEAARTRLHGEYPSFVVLLSGNAALEPLSQARATVAHLWWDGYVDAVDMLMYATYSMRSDKDWKRRLLARVASEVACYDPTVVDLLCDLPDDVILRPTVPLRELARSRGWDNEPQWSDGSSAAFNGAPEVHSAHPSCAALEYRVWRAQVAELFPILEMRRLESIERFGRYLTVPKSTDRMFVTTIQDLELTDVIRQLSALAPDGVADRTEIATLKRWRGIRNKLAHGEVVDLSLVDDGLFRPIRIPVRL